MSDYTELVKELRNKYRAYVATDNEKPGRLFREAADAIEELEKKMLNWQATADDHWEAYQHWFHKYTASATVTRIAMPVGKGGVKSRRKHER